MLDSATRSMGRPRWADLGGELAEAMEVRRRRGGDAGAGDAVTRSGDDRAAGSAVARTMVRKNYTWTADNGDVYIGTVVSTANYGSGSAAQSKSAQALDAYGNITL